MGTKALWVEDQQEMNRAFRQVMEESGLEVSVAESVQEAIDQIRREVFDVVLLDLLVPLGDGPDVDALESLPRELNGQLVARNLRELETREERSPSRVLCITNFLHDADRAALESLNVEVHEKTIYLREFREILRDWPESTSEGVDR